MKNIYLVIALLCCLVFIGGGITSLVNHRTDIGGTQEILTIVVDKELTPIEITAKNPIDGTQVIVPFYIRMDSLYCDNNIFREIKTSRL